MKRVLMFLVTVMLGFFTYAEQDQPASECCFERKGYQGTCRVTPSEGETCASILAYLNTPGTVGKNYCGSSKLRGEWKEVRCPEKEPAE